MTKGIIVSVVAAIIFVIGQFLLERYMKLDVVTKFNIHEIYTSHKIKHIKGPKLHFIELIIDNNSAERKTVSDLKIFGINKLHDSFRVLTGVIKASQENGKFVSMNQGEYYYLQEKFVLEKNGTLKIHLHADFDGAVYSTIKIGGNIQSFDKMVYVYGVENFFSSNWKYLMVLIFFMFVFILYVYQAKNSKPIQ